ncbi:hypothetical protein GCM10027082_06840 [Comamonas humi]
MSACASKPKTPDWALNEHSAAERATDAYLSGKGNVAAVEWERARQEVQRTARPDLLARLELVRCAAQVAALETTACEAYEPLAASAAPPEQAYARYLRGALQPGDAALLPQQHQAVAIGASPQAAASALAGIPDPLARLVAAGALAARGPVSMAVVQQAVDTASAQGWSRPLMAWLTNQQRLAQEQGDAALAAEAQRRLQLLAPK